MASGRASALLGLLLLAAAGAGSAGGAEGVYVVEQGDTLSAIAQRYDTSVSRLARLNNLRDVHRLRPGQRLRVPAAAPRDITYVVKEGDVLSRIARDHRVDVHTLVAYNRLSTPDRLRIGDEIRIPVSGDAHSAPALPYELQRRLDRVGVRAGRWRYIVIHHSASRRGTIKGMDRFHREERHMENGLAYHFVIGNGQGIPDGKVEPGHRWTKQLQGGHMASAALNNTCIGVCLVGNFDETKPTRRQMDSLQALCTYLTRRCRLDASRLKTHQQINTRPTRCPGRHFPLAAFLRDFRG